MASSKPAVDSLANPTALDAYRRKSKETTSGTAKPGEELLQVVIETPRGSRNKFSFDTEQRIFHLKSQLPAGMVFPWDFGFVPCTIGGDDDPLDALVLMDESAFPAALCSSVFSVPWRSSRPSAAKPNATIALSSSPRSRSSSPISKLSTTSRAKSSQKSTNSSPPTIVCRANNRARSDGEKRQRLSVSSTKRAAVIPVDDYRLFCAASTAAPTRNTVDSSKCLPSTCTPIGNPAAVVPAGALIPQIPASDAATE